jgi:nucleoside-triphosphatase
VGQAVLLTGRPGVGKTTCLLKALALLGRPAQGFFTEEIVEDGRRTGFALETLGGRRAVLARVGFPGRARVGKYGVDLDALEAVGVPAIYAGIALGALVVIDEIGKMEMASAAFRQAVEAALASPVPILGTILRAPHPWADGIRRHPAVQVVEVTPATRDALPRDLAARLGPRDPRG